MPVRRIPCRSGLITDPSALEDLPPGAMLQADNVLLHRAGAIQPRPGFGDTTGIASRTTADYRPMQALAFDGDVIVLSYGVDLTPPTARAERLSTNSQYTGSFALIGDEVGSTPVGRFPWFRARGSLYICTDDGIRKLDSIGGSFVRAGVIAYYASPYYSLNGADAGDDAIALDSTAADVNVAYRLVFVRTDANGYEIRSAPSSRVIVSATTSGFANGAWVEFDELFLPDSGTGWEAQAGDVIEAYRTRNVPMGTDPGEDYYLATTYTLSAADITAGEVDTSDDFQDRTPDHALGVALYSSSSQRGALAAKEVPPNAHACTVWQDVAWLGATVERQTLAVTLRRVGVANEGLCVVDGTYSGVSGDDLTGVSLSADEWAALRVGMWISDSTAPGLSAGGIVGGSTIVAFDSGAMTITLSDAPSGSGNIKAGDIVRIGTTAAPVEFYTNTSSNVTLRTFDVANLSSTHEEQVREVAENLARIVSSVTARGNARCYALKDDFNSGGSGDLLLIDAIPETTTGAETITISCTRENTFTPEVFDGLSTTAGENLHPNRLQWSSPSEPEAWPPANFTDVGREDAYVLAMVPLERGMLVFKEDGIWAVTGYPPSGWVVNQISRTHRLLSCDCTAVLGDVCYAWTGQGIIAVTVGGVGPVVSAPIADQLRTVQQLVGSECRDGRRGFWLEAHPHIGLIIAASASTTDAERSSRWHVYHPETGRWARWGRQDYMAYFDDDEARLLVSPGHDAWSMLYERNDEDAAASYRDEAATGVTVTWSTTTLIKVLKTAIDWTPAAGDVAVDLNGTASVVASVSDGTTTWDLTLASALAGADTVALHQGIPCTMLWHAQRVPGNSTRWHEIHAELLDGESEYLAAWTLALGGQTDRDAAPLAVEPSVTSDVARSRTVRVGPPRDIVRAAHLYPYAQVLAAGVRWRISELALHGNPTGRRVRR